MREGAAGRTHELAPVHPRARGRLHARTIPVPCAVPREASAETRYPVATPSLPQPTSDRTRLVIVQSENIKATYRWLKAQGLMILSIVDSTDRPEPILFLDDHRGIYIPRDFAACVKRECVTGVDDDTWSTLENPDHEWYWEAWQDVCDRAIVTDEKGNTYNVYQDGACWLIPVGMEWDDRTESHFWASPMRVTISNSDDDDGMVTVYCDDQRQARLDHSVSLDGQSSNWECPRDMDVAYASLCSFYDLSAALTAGGYVVDDSEYTPPSAEDLAYWAYRNDAENDDAEVLNREAWLQTQGGV